MRGLIITALSVLALSGCGGEEPAREAEVSDTPTPSATSTPSDPTYVESDACRADAQTALEIAFAQCTGDVARPAMESIDAVSTAVDAAIMGTGGNVGKQLAKAQTRLDTAQAALVATN